MDLKRNILRVFSANFLTMISSILIGFVVPAILSVESYALVKTYVFYVSYIGFLHFGYIDGLYIKYGGVEPEDVDYQVLKNEHLLFLLMQAIVTVVLLIIAFVTKDLILFLMAVSIIPINASTFHKHFYQATGQFDQYAKVSYLYTVVYLIMNIGLALVFRSESYILYCLTTLVANLAVFLVVEYQFFKNYRQIKSKLDIQLLSHIKIGVFILIGNLSVMLFYAIDRWFIKLFFTVEDFGYYSFAISMLNIINVLVSAISVTFYNYLSKGEDEEKLKKLKSYFLMLGGLASIGYFALAAVVSVMLQKYEPALNVIAISFAAYPYMIVINALYVNLYKTRKDEKKYVKVVFKMVVLAAIYNSILLAVFKTPEAIAWGTTLSFITWYFYSLKDFSYFKSHIAELLYLSILAISFIYCAYELNWFVGGCTYLLIYIVSSLVTYRTLIVDELTTHTVRVRSLFLKR